MWMDLDPFGTAAAWSKLAADGISPSTELSLADETTRVRFGSDGKSARITASTSSLGHLLRRARSPVDLSTMVEIRVWISSSRAADGSAERPFFLEMRLGSAAMPISDPSNHWHRYLPVSQGSTWESVRLSIRDLPAPVRSAVDEIQLRVVDASTEFTCYLDDLIAGRPEMLGDAEAALMARLNNSLVLAGSPVPAVVAIAGVASSEAKPFLRIVHYDLRPSDARTTSTRAIGDFSAEGSLLRPQAFAYDLFYQVEAYADDRASQASMIEFVLGRLPPRGEIVVAGLPLPVEMVSIPVRELIGGHRGDVVPITYRIGARQDDVAAALPVKAVRTLRVDADAGS